MDVLLIQVRVSGLPENMTLLSQNMQRGEVAQQKTTAYIRPRHFCKLAVLTDAAHAASYYASGQHSICVYIASEPATCWYQPPGDHPAQDCAATDAACLLLTPLASQPIPAKSVWI